MYQYKHKIYVFGSVGDADSGFGFTSLTTVYYTFVDYIAVNNCLISSRKLNFNVKFKCMFLLEFE